MKHSYLAPQFVEVIPEILNEGVLYISQRYGTVVHKCCCGCGQEVVTPLTPTDWSIEIDGGAVSLYPSIGNWSFSCQSHYWIKKNRVLWSGHLSQQQINRIRSRDRTIKDAYYGDNKNVPASSPSLTARASKQSRTSIWDLLKQWWNR